MESYKRPEPRSHSEWCQVLGLTCQGSGCENSRILTYDEFCFLPETILSKVGEGPLYDFWRKYGDVCGEPRTVKEWLDDNGFQIVEPVTEQDIEDLNLFLGWDEFMDWAGGKVDFNPTENIPSLFDNLFQKLRKFFIPK